MASIISVDKIILELTKIIILILRIGEEFEVSLPDDSTFDWFKLEDSWFSQRTSDNSVLFFHLCILELPLHFKTTEKSLKTNMKINAKKIKATAISI